MDHRHIIDLASPIPEGLVGQESAIAVTDVAAQFEAMKIRLRNTVGETTVMASGSQVPVFEVLDCKLASRAIQAMDDLVAAFIENHPWVY